MSKKSKTFDDILKRCLETPLPRKKKTATRKEQPKPPPKKK